MNNNVKQVLDQYSEFMFSKCKQDLLGENRPNRLPIIEIVDKQTLINIFKYDDTPQWEKYIIDLDKKPDYNAFSKDNPLYKHTLRIFKTKTEIYGIEKVIRTQKSIEEFAENIKQAAAFAKKQGIIPLYRTAEDIYIIKELDEIKIKFKYFRLDGGGTNGQH